MCGRFPQSRPIQRYMEEVYPEWRDEPAESRAPTWNLAPSTLAWTIRAIDSQPKPSLLKWGFSDGVTTKGMAPINARIETADELYLFRDSWKQRRCLVPADGWYEWKAEGTGKQPYYFTRRDGKPVFFAGIWSGNTFATITMAADGELAEVHNRKPVTMDTPEAREWLHGRPVVAKSLIPLAVTASAFTFYAVGKAVSSWKNDGPQLIERIAA
jgi:putative SOS response-associated peptidase YedK